MRHHVAASANNRLGKGLQVLQGLYIYAEDQSQIVYLIAIGDKDAQHADIEYCKDFVETLNTQPPGGSREE